MKGTPDQPTCGFSARTVAILQSVGKPFAAVDILPDPRIRQELSALSNWPTIPQLFIDGELVGGCDIVTEMYESRRARAGARPRGRRWPARERRRSSASRTAFEQAAAAVDREPLGGEHDRRQLWSALRFESRDAVGARPDGPAVAEEELELSSAADVAAAIRRLQIRGAPLIGVAAAYGIALELRRDPREQTLEWAC